jgi:hypothetical protein
MILSPQKLKCVRLNKPPGLPASANWNPKIHFVEMTYQELVRFYVAITKDDLTRAKEFETLRFDKKSMNTTNALVKMWDENSGFYGGTTDDARTYIRDGYKTSAMIGEFLPGVLRTRSGESLRGQWIWNDYGDEIDVGLALSGDAQPFRSFESAATLGGMNINALMAFNSGTDFNVIAQYGQWVARLLATCAGAGVSPGLCIDHYGNGTTHKTDDSLVRIRVKQENDAIDWARYSALFSPIGYRHLCFASLLRASGDPNGLPGGIGSDLGRACGPNHNSNDWDLGWDHATRTITLWGPTNPREFPADEMTRKLIECGALTPREVHV